MCRLIDYPIDLRARAMMVVPRMLFLSINFVSCRLILDGGFTRGKFPLNQCSAKAPKSPKASRKSSGNGGVATHPLRAS